MAGENESLLNLLILLAQTSNKVILDTLELCSILKYKMMEASISVNPFASHTGRLLEANP